MRSPGKWLNALLIFVVIPLPSPNAATDPTLTTTSIIQNLHVPWEIRWGPDDWIWMTERNGRFSRVHPETGEQQVLLNLPVWEQGESGMLGFAFHPSFIDSPYVFIAYTHPNLDSGFLCVERFTYTGSALVSPLRIFDSTRAGPMHNGCRLAMLPDHTLLMTTGNVSMDNDPNTPSLDTSKYEGKTLRMNLDGSVPFDNPFPGSLVYSYGHRNPQGLVVLPGGLVISSEHGPSTDDEINIIKKGANYGWPAVKGACDQPSEMAYCDSVSVVEPVMSWTPTIAPAGIDFYDNPAIPQWSNSLLLMTLKEKDIRILKMNADRDSIVGEAIALNNTFGRLRDLCISPEGDVYVSTSNDDGKGFPKTGDDRIVRIRSSSYAGVVESSIAASDGSPSGITAKGSTITMHRPGAGPGIVTFFDLNGRTILRTRFSMGTFMVRMEKPAGAYGYRIAMDHGPSLRGVIVMQGHRNKS
jgi:glucose/arabinose dehydrogenase